jgi:putative flavoprotein involved in K+ transport
MPEVFFGIRWPDGAEQRCASPSRAIEKSLVAGGRYPVAEFVRRSREGLDAAAARVQERFGFRCTAAVEQVAAIEAGAREHGGLDLGEPAAGGGEVVVARLGRAPSRPRFPAPDRIDGEHEVVVIGGGQAGLSASHCLGEHGIEHLVLERDRVAHNWSDARWDAFCLVTPNFQCRLPGFDYPGADPDGFMVKDEIVEYVDAYVERVRPPLYEGVAVERLIAGEEGFTVETSRGTVAARSVVLAVGGYHVPRFPALAAALPPRLTQLHSSGYRNPESLPDGAMLVVGTGQSGAQIAEDLHLAGRQVHLCVGSAPRVARFYRGRDCVAWLEDIGHYDMPIDDHPQGVDARHEPNHYVTGRDGGRDIDLRAHARDGMRLHGRLLACDDGVVSFGHDLAANLDAADATAERIKDRIDRWIAEEGIDAPTESRYSPVWAPSAEPEPPLDLAAAGVASVVWATGFTEDWSWVEAPVFDERGAPIHRRGVSELPGLYFLGLPWLYTWGSGRFAGIARDAEFVADDVASKLATPAR